MARRPTIIDVARLAGVSKATVARVVNGDHDIVREETRQRVTAAVEKLGYERNAIAGSLRTNQTFMIALSIPDITNPFWPEVARGVQDTLEEHGYATVTVNSDWNAHRENTYLSMVRRNRFDGLIINPTSVQSRDLRTLGIPVVILGSGEGFPEFDSVGSDSEAATEEALDYLFALGHRRIGLIAGRSRRSQYRATSRYNSFVLFHAKHSIPLDDDLIVHGDFTQEAGFEAMQKLLSLTWPPTAVFAANDILALGALKAAQNMNYEVPKDVSIIGMDDIYAAALGSPGLTTVRKPKYEIGTQAARLLLDRMKQQGPLTEPMHLLIPCELIRRDSTTAPGV